MNLPQFFFNVCRFAFLTIFGVTFFLFTAIAQQKKENDQLIKNLRRIKSKDSIESYSRELIDLARKNNDPLFEARVLMAQSMKVYKNGDEIKALDLAYKARPLTSIKDSVTLMKTETMIAYMLNRRGKNVEALNVAFAILKETEKHGWKALSIECRNCIADIYRMMASPQKALPYALQASKDAYAIKDTNMIMFSLNTLSNLYSARQLETVHNFALAAKYLEILLAPPFVGKISSYTKAQNLTNLGRIYVMQARFTDAERVLQQSLAISQTEKFAALEAHALNELMTAETDLKNYTKAIALGKQALGKQQVAEASRVQMRNIYRQFMRAYAGVGDYKEAYFYSVKAKAINDSINTHEAADAASMFDARYNADKQILIEANNARLATLQRNFIIAISIIVLIGLVATFRWISYKRKREAAVLDEQHKQLERLDAMKTRFFANISHELRTPLTLIMGPAQQLLDEPGLNPIQQGRLQMVLKNSRKLLNMVGELLDLGKIEAGSMPLKLTPVNLSQLISVLYQGFASAAAYKKINFTLENTINAAVLVQLDTDKFEKIANNLIGNAVKFTPTEGTVVVEAEIKDNHIVFSVTDSAKGIKAEELPYVFDRYYQGTREDTPLEGGTGIGLAIAREFAELMGGEIKVESTWGIGSRFTVTIPEVAASAGAEILVPLADELSAPEPVTAVGDKIILMVEDHHEMARYIGSVISPYYQVVVTGNGKEALEKLKTMPQMPDLIISDVMMPEMDGFTLLDHLKADASYWRIPVVMLTALADSENKLRALNIGVDDYLTKPFLSIELLSRVNNLLMNAANRFRYSEQDDAELAEVEALADDEHQDAAAPPHVISAADLHWLAELEALVKKYIGKTDLNLDMLSYDLSISERQLFRRIKSLTGLTPNKYIRTIRLQIAREAIESGKYRTIAEISYVAGFDTPAYFSKLFKEHYGRDVNELL